MTIEQAYAEARAAGWPDTDAYELALMVCAEQEADHA